MEQMPVFVKVDEYHEVLNLIKNINRRLDEARDTLGRVHELKNEEDHQLELWQSALGEIQRKVEFISHSLSEPEKVE